MLNRRRGCLWFAAGLLLALTAGILAFVTMVRVAATPKAGEEQPRVQVVVAARDIPLHTVITNTDVALLNVPPDMVPADGLKDPDSALGQLTTTDIAQGEIILRQRLLTPDYVGPRAAFTMDPKQVIVAFPAYDLLSSLGIIRPGDHVDLMYSFDFAKANPGLAPSMNTFTVLQDLRVAAVIYAPSEGQQQSSASQKPQAILLAVSPQDALVIKYFRDFGAAPDFALRSPAAEGLFEVNNVDGDYVLRRFQIRTRSVK